ncbi:MAG: response regulator [Cyanobacteria bacterium P01_A01_bin.105]
MAKLLLVEDNELNRDMLSRRLRRRGYEVEIAVDGAVAVAMATETPFDLILMDMSLPVLDGWEATRRLKSQASTQAVPIIALTAHAMVGDRESALAAGCDDYDTKPVDLKRLVAKVKALLPDEAVPSRAPSVPAAAPEPASVAVASASSATGSTVLVVDDNEDNRDMLTRRLQRRGYGVRLADSGEAALQEIGRGQPLQLILLDIMMPGMDGIETLQRIRADYSRHQLPVIMVTAKAESNDMVRAFELGANDYITKPIDFAVALARIQMHLSTAQVAMQTAVLPAPAPPRSVVVDAPVASAPVASAPAANGLNGGFNGTSSTNGSPPAAMASPSVPVAPLSVPPPATSEPLFANRYQVQAPVRQDVLGPISIAFDQQAQQPVLLQVFQVAAGADNSAVATAFMQEIEGLSLLRSHLPPLDYGQAGGTFYMAHSLGHGFDRERLLHTLLAYRRPWSLASVISLMDSMLTQLIPFHEQQRPHGGIRADAFVQKTAEDVMLIDSGLGKRMLMRLSQQSPDYRKKLLAERDYLPLEQRIGRLVMSSDLYAAGLIGVQALTGKSLAALSERGNPADWQRHATVSPEVTTWFNNLVSGNHIERYEQALEARAALRALPDLKAVV